MRYRGEGQSPLTDERIARGNHQSRATTAFEQTWERIRQTLGERRSKVIAFDLDFGKCIRCAFRPDEKATRIYVNNHRSSPSWRDEAPEFGRTSSEFSGPPSKEL